MKTLSDYINAAQTKAFDDAGAFFAFSNEQLEAKIQPNTKYVNMGAGLICRKDSYKQLQKALDDITAGGIRQDIEENGIDNIIRRELSNHEAYYTGDIEDTVEALADYHITAEQVMTVFNS